ncbi:hypothetical protein DUNSADRAFT_2631 [Dunaliella salina]|uniref:Splicing factor U2af 38 kDa subunit n=1 Tax=Dunaliella salina TaxID=3046 RepID=A0ABQ7FWH4_DUNSA|nr:hypothetical protein DUNSADRAFT_2631 [Dunaliella salina]|eukprot:KAF5826587.1 hypothetical protein DUNSADRAFT_2631 [Dunaliella salina]
MAEHLASIFGTEKDRVNCPFYFKIGSCRHGDRCSRMHNRPTISQTILLQNMYQNPVINAPLGPDGLPTRVDEKAAQQEYEDFYEDVFEELAQFGELENVNVCDNLADHMVGNVYVKFREEESAAKALAAFQGRYYNGRPIICEFSPVTDFRESTCRQYEEETCKRGGYCNFMHLKPISKDLRKRLFGRYKRRSPDRDRDRKSSRRSRSRSRDRRGGRDDRDRRDRDRGRDYGRNRDSGRGGGRDDSAERRARIQSWNKPRGDGGGGALGMGGGYGAPGAAAPAPAYGAPPGGYMGGYGAPAAPDPYAAAAQAGAYGAPPGPPPTGMMYGAPPCTPAAAPPAYGQYTYPGAPPPGTGY